jgi:hypothetical protein
MGGILFNAAFYLHAHCTESGQLIVHAHPFNKTNESKNPNTQHQHNKIEIQVIQTLDYFMDADIHLVNLDPGYFLAAKYSLYDCFVKSSHLNHLKNYRAPPIFLISS